MKTSKLSFLWSCRMKVKYEDFINALDNQKIEVNSIDNQFVSLTSFYNFRPYNNNINITIDGKNIYISVDKLSKRYVFRLFMLVSLLLLLIYPVTYGIIAYLIIVIGWDTLEPLTYIFDKIVGYGTFIISVLTILYWLYNASELNPFKAYKFFVDKRKEKMWSELVSKDMQIYKQIKNEIEN